jgi:two-component system sensor histidine kinase/response regulator
VKKQHDGKAKMKIALAALFVSGAIAIVCAVFVGAVREQLWQQSISTIRESTQQGCNTLRVQLENEYQVLTSLTNYLSRYSSGQTEELNRLISSYGNIDSGIALYLEDGTGFPTDIPIDEAAAEYLSETEQEQGIIDPHICSSTGINEFNLYTKVVLQDQTEGYLIKGYEVGSIVDSFTVSFYQNAGFSYVVDTDGNVLIRPPHPGSNKTVKNLFDMLPASQNASGELEEFAQSLKDKKTGWAAFTYQGEDTVFCYIPLELDSDWYLISIIPRNVVEAQTNQILIRTFILIAAILLGIALIAVVYIRYAKRINKRLQSQTNYIGHLYNAIPEGIALMTVEEPYRILQLNQEGLRLLHYPGDASNNAAEGKNLQEVLHPEDYNGVADIFRDTVITSCTHAFENRVLKADGSFFWAAGLVEKTLGEDGTPILIATFHDITSEKLAKEEEEREKLQERRMLISAVSDVFPVIISLNLTQDLLNFIYTMPGLMTNIGKQVSYTELYQDFLKAVHPDFREEFRLRLSPESLSRTLGHEKQEVFLEAKLMLSDGIYHWTSTQIIYADNPYSGDQLAILLSRRIDEQRYEEERQRQALESALESAKAASEAKSQFLSNMSHDIRTPMNAIVGMTAIASAHVEEHERVMECLKKINLSSKHLLSLINDILDMSKIESGKMSLREEPFNLAELVSEVAELVRPQADSGQLQMHIRLAELEEEMVIGDPLRIRQICVNILSNAVKYTQEGGTVSFKVYQERNVHSGYQNFVFECKDTGVGMSKEFLDKLFLPFERAQDTTHSKTVGTGLGMAITKNIVDMMSGDIQVESIQGKGSTFTVTLPMKLQNAPQEDVPEQWVGVHSLVVDDDRRTCESASALLEDMGLRAEFVVEGAAAVSLVVKARDTEDPFELIIIDWKMPDLDGVEVTRRIRREVGQEVPVIILTAYDWAEIESEARAAGVTAFLSKPFYRSKICYLLSELDEERKPLEYNPMNRKPDFKGRRVLLVEDNCLNREIARTLIEEMGASVEEAFDGREAVQRFNDSPEGYYWLILMDIQMPVMDGYEATKAIRLLERQDARDVPIIAMTANAFEEDRRTALQMGMTDHFSKPVDVKELEKLLNRYLDGGE